MLMLDLAGPPATPHPCDCRLKTTSGCYFPLDLRISHTTSSAPAESVEAEQHVSIKVFADPNVSLREGFAEIASLRSQ